MSHFLASFGHLLRAHTDDEGRAPADPDDRARASTKASGALSIFGLRPDHRASDPRRLLGEFGLLAGDEAASRPLNACRHHWI